MEKSIVEKQARAVVEAVLSQQSPDINKRIWGQDEHIHLIAKMIQAELGEDIVGDPELAAIKATLRIIKGGNASAYRQDLEAAKLLPEAKRAALKREYV